MIRLENVCFAYEKEIALRYVDLHINRGDSIVIQGPNGCGKSTLIKLLNGIIFPSEGKYFYQGHEINEKALKTASLQNGFISRWDMCFRMQIPSFSVEVWRRKLHLARSRWGFRKRRLKKEQKTACTYLDWKN